MFVRRFLDLCLLALPRDFREEYRRDLEAFWELQSRESRYRGLLGQVWLCFHVGRDCLRTGTAMRLGRDESGTRPDLGGSGPGPSAKLRFALRGLRKNPLYATVTTATLALGIAATLTLFSVVDGVLLDPLPFPGSDRLVRVFRVDDPARDKVAWPDFADWDEQAQGFSGLAAYTPSQLPVTWEDVTERYVSARVTHDYFQVLGFAPQQGRTFTVEEDSPDGPAAAIISFGLWQSRFGGNPDVLEQSLMISGRSTPIVGVMPADFEGPSADTDLWVPLRHDALLAEVGLPTGTRSLAFLDVLGRVATADLEGVEQAFTRTVTRIDEEVGRSEGGAVELVGLREALVGDVARMLWFLQAAVVLVLIVACANVAGLALTRASGRSREFAVRSALGAPGRHLAGLVFAESALIAGGAAVLGLGLAVLLVKSVVALAPPELPRLDRVGLDGSSVVLALGLACLAAVVFGLAPALAAARTRLSGALASGARGSSASPQALRPQRVLVVGQVALSVVLLCAAALLGNSFLRLMTVERGFETQNILVADINPPADVYDTAEEVDQYYSELLTRIRAHPGIASATTTYSPPLADNSFSTSLRLEDEGDDVDARWAGTVVVRDDYFEATGTPLVRGRAFGPEHTLGTPPVVIVNQAMADLFWPGQDPIGQRFRFAGGISGSSDSYSREFFPNEPYTVIGVAGNLRRESLDQAPGPEYYRPHTQITWATQFLIARTTSNLESASGAIRAAVAEVDGRVPVPNVESLSDQVRASVAAPRFRTLLLLGFAGLTCALAMVGLYAVLTLSVSRRRREMGVRLALGATPARLRRSILGSGGRLVAVGLVLGLLAAAFGTRALSDMLFDVSPTDPLTYGGVLALVAVVALGASLGPALRASRVDPMESLRAET